MPKTEQKVLQWLQMPFFPYRDSVDAAVQKGVTAIIAPGRSIRDSESIDAANEAGIAMAWSGVRAFLH